jgi:hypothetical protein
VIAGSVRNWKGDEVLPDRWSRALALLRYVYLSGLRSSVIRKKG